MGQEPRALTARGPGGDADMGAAGAHALSARPPALQRAGVRASRGQGRSSPLPRPLPPALGPRHFRTLRPCQHVDDSASRASAPSAPEASERAGPVGRRNATGDGRVQRSFTPKASALWPPRGRAHRASPLPAFLVWSRVRPARWLRCEDGRSQCGRRVGPEPQRRGPATLRRTAPPRGDLQAAGAGTEHHLPGWPVRHGALGSVM